MRHKVFTGHKPQYHYLIIALHIVPHTHTQPVLDKCVRHFWKEERGRADNFKASSQSHACTEKMLYRGLAVFTVMLSAFYLLRWEACLALRKFMIKTVITTLLRDNLIKIAVSGGQGFGLISYY